jgi:hypothetical protein
LRTRGAIRILIGMATTLTYGLRPVEAVFAHYLALGYTQTAALLAARPEISHQKRNSLHVRASRMANNPAVQEKVRELQALADRSAAISLAGISERVDRDWELAHETGNAGAAVSATKLKAQLHRHLERESSAGDVLKDVVALIDGLDRLTASRAEPDTIDVTPDKPTDSR